MQYVYLNGIKDKQLQVKTGVSWGSVLGNKDCEESRKIINEDIVT